MDLQSILGYQNGSPYLGRNPYLDINTPNGLIDMSNTPIDLEGIDNLGNKKKMKAGRKKPYKFAGTVVREIPMQQGGTYASVYGPQAEAKMLETNRLTQGILERRGDPNAATSVSIRSINDPILKFTGDVGVKPTVDLATSLPFGISPSNVYQTNEGYYYLDNNSGKPVPVNPQSLFSASATIKNPNPPTIAPLSMNSVAKNTRNPYQQGGTIQDIYKYIFADDDDEYTDENYTSVENTAPSEEEVQEQLPQSEEADEYAATMQLAMMQDEHQVTKGNPYMFNNSRSAGINSRSVGINPYMPTQQSSVSNPSKYAYEFFKSKGLPAHISAGIVGNLIQESGNFRPDVITDDIQGDNGMSHGIAQWQKDRWPAFLGWAASQGKNPKNLDTQLEYVYAEAAQRGDLQRVMSARTPEEAANIFAKHYERPAHIDKNRARNARQLYQQ